MNVLRQAEKAGVKKFVVTSSIVALMPVDDPAKIKGIYTTERRLFLLCSELNSETYFPLQIGIQ